MNWENWLLDVTYDPPVFVPYEDDGSIVFGMNIMTSECPGNLIGVIHTEGQEAVEKWLSENPKWHEMYAKKKGRRK